MTLRLALNLLSMSAASFLLGFLVVTWWRPSLTAECWIRTSDDFIDHYGLRSTICAAAGRSYAPREPNEEVGFSEEFSDRMEKAVEGLRREQALEEGR